MIGFTVPVVVWTEGGRLHETAILSLDTDDNIEVELRIAGGDVIVNCDPEDLFDAAYNIKMHHDKVQRERRAKVQHKSEARA